MPYLKIVCRLGESADPWILRRARGGYPYAPRGRYAEVAQDAEPDLRELITARRAELQVQAEELAVQLQAVRDELEELTVAERVARRLAEEVSAEAMRKTPPAVQVAGRAVLAVPQRERDMDESVLPADYQKIMDVVRRAGGPVMVRQVCTELGVSL